MKILNTGEKVKSKSITKRSWEDTWKVEYLGAKLGNVEKGGGEKKGKCKNRTKFRTQKTSGSVLAR